MLYERFYKSSIIAQPVIVGAAQNTKCEQFVKKISFAAGVIINEQLGEGQVQMICKKYRKDLRKDILVFDISRNYIKKNKKIGVG